MPLPLACARFSREARIVVFPSGTLTVERGGGLQLWAAVTGSGAGNQMITWSVTGTENLEETAIDEDGFLRVARDEAAENLTVQAVSAANPALSNTAEVGVVDRAVTLSRVESVRNADGTTYRLVFYFNRDIDGLREDDFTFAPKKALEIHGGFTKVEGAVGVYTVDVVVTQPGTVVVKVVKEGYETAFNEVAVAYLNVVDPVTASIKEKFGVTKDGKDGVTDTFNALRQYIQGGGLAPSSTVIRLGDWIDLEGGLTVDAYPGEDGSGGGGFSYSGPSEDTRLIVVGINSFQSGRGTFPGGDGTTVDGTTQNGQTDGQYTIIENDATPHVVFHFQGIPVERRMNPTNINVGGYRDSEMRQYLLQKFLPGLIDATGIPQDALWAPLRYVSTKGSGDTAIQDALWLPTEREMSQNGKDSDFDTGLYSDTTDETAANQARFEYYTNNIVRTKHGTSRYWEASPYAASV
jgi:hypothetical protein